MLAFAGDERLRVRVDGEPLLVRVLEPMPAVLLPGRGLGGPRVGLVEPLVWGVFDPTLGDRPRPVILSFKRGTVCLYHLIKFCNKRLKCVVVGHLRG